MTTATTSTRRPRTARPSSSPSRAPAVDWVTALGPDQGEADVYIDDKLVKRVNLANPARVTTQQVFTQSGLKDGSHTLRIVKVSGDVLRNDMIRYTTGK